MRRRHPDFVRIFGETPLLNHLATGFTFTEGPVWCGDHLLFCDVMGNRLVRYQMLEEGPCITTFRYPSFKTSGCTLDHMGRLVTSEYTTRRVSRTELDGSITVLASRYQTWRLSSPNDLVVSSDGTVYFTDPPYGLCNAERDQDIPFNGVFKVNPDGTNLTLLLSDLELPNGLTFSPDEKTLYIANTKPMFIMSYPVLSDGCLGEGTVFARMDQFGGEDGKNGKPDGMKVDSEGNVYCGGPWGLWVFSPSGSLIGILETPEVCQNIAWGGSDWRDLYMTCGGGLYLTRTTVPGVPVGMGGVLESGDEKKLANTACLPTEDVF